MDKTKRISIIVGLCLLIALTGYINFKLNNPSESAKADNAKVSASADPMGAMEDSDVFQITSETESEEAGNDAYFSTFKTDRNSVREKEIAYLDSMINDKNTDPETLKTAQQQKLDSISNMEKEVTIEGLIQAKGFSQVVVTLHKGSVNVVVAKQKLSEGETAQILDIVSRESGESPENITIIPR